MMNALMRWLGYVPREKLDAMEQWARMLEGLNERWMDWGISLMERRSGIDALDRVIVD